MELNLPGEMFEVFNEYFPKANGFLLNRKRAIQAGIRSPETEVAHGTNVRVPKEQISDQFGVDLNEGEPEQYHVYLKAEPKCRHTLRVRYAVCRYRSPSVGG